MIISALRHTETCLPEGICYGISDVGLGENFDKSLLEIANNLSAFSFDLIYTSPLHRCKIIADKLFTNQSNVHIDVRLREMNFGNWEMQSWQTISKTETAQIWFEDFVNIAAPDGESFKILIERVNSFIEDLTSANQAKNVLLITHAGVIRALYVILHKIDPVKTFDIKVNYGQLITF